MERDHGTGGLNDRRFSVALRACSDSCENETKKDGARTCDTGAGFLKRPLLARPDLVWLLVGIHSGAERLDPALTLVV